MSSLFVDSNPQPIAEQVTQTPSNASMDLNIFDFMEIFNGLTGDKTNDNPFSGLMSNKGSSGGLLGDFNPLSALPGGGPLGGLLGSIDDGIISPILGSEVAQKVAPMIGMAAGGPIGSAIATAVTTAAAQEDGILNDEGGINHENVMAGAASGASSYFLGGVDGNMTGNFQITDLFKS